jgi:hypothetical protein
LAELYSYCGLYKQPFAWPLQPYERRLNTNCA